MGQVDANGYYYINILGEASHKLSAVLQAPAPSPHQAPGVQGKN